MIRSKGEAGTGNIVEAVRHLRSILGDIRKVTQADSAELFDWAKQLQAPLPLVQEIAETGRLPVPMFCAGGIATPADAALVMQLGAEAVFVGSGIFKSANPPLVAKAIVEATTNFRDADILAKVSRGLGEAMPGLEIDSPRDQVRRPGLVMEPPGAGRRRIGVLALQGASAAHADALRRLGADAGRGPHPGAARRRRRRRPARRRVDHHVVPARQQRAARARWPSAWPTGMPAFGTCAGMILLATDVLDGRARPALASARSTSPCAATPSAARSTRSRPTSTSTGLDEPVPRRVHPGPGRRAVGDGRRGPGRRWTAQAGAAAARARSWSSSFHPS